LVSALERYVERAPELIQGWEADKRTCVGAKRGPLRQAARSCYSASKKVRSASTPASEPAYRAAVQKLLQELELAGEADFDGLLKEALTWFKGGKPASLADLDDAHQAAFARVKKHLYHGRFWGKASERDLTAATAAAERVRAAWRELERSPGSRPATEAYILAADDLARECDACGEVDYDGLMRQAVQVLDASGGDKAESNASQAKGSKRPLEKGKGTGKGKGYGKGRGSGAPWGSHNAAAA